LLRLEESRVDAAYSKSSQKKRHKRLLE